MNEILDLMKVIVVLQVIQFVMLGFSLWAAISQHCHLKVYGEYLVAARAACETTLDVISKAVSR